MPKLDFYLSTDAESWLGWAESTFEAARLLFQSNRSQVLFPAVVLGHLALEMYLKAALIAHGHRVVFSQRGVKGGRKNPTDVWGHELPDLADKLSAEVQLSAEVKDGLREFHNYFAEVRYPQILVNAGGIGKREGKLLEKVVRTLRPLAKKRPNGRAT
jgi:HEPN domain-containing protein